MRLSLINTVSAIMSVDLDLMSPSPSVAGRGAHGGYCGPAVKPIALRMLGEIARDTECRGLPLSGIGGSAPGAMPRSSWRWCRHGASVHGRHGLRFQSGRGHDRRAGQLDGRQGLPDAAGIHRQGAPNFLDWEQLDLNYTVKARIDQTLCIQCGRCHIVCEDTAHQAISRGKDGKRHFEVIDAECVGCNLCVNVCPVDNCITLVELPVGTIDPRTGAPVAGYANWTTHPNNPAAHAHAENLAPAK